MRKELLDYFAGRCQIQSFDVEKDIRNINGRTRLKGVFAATGLYGVAFLLAYNAWTNAHISHEIFLKVSWIILLPASIAGMLVWLISFNREENYIRSHLNAAMRKTEAEDGFLWRYGPLLSWAQPSDYDTKQVVNHSRQRQLDEIDPDTYATVMVTLHALLQDLGDKQVSDEVMQEMEQNLEAAE